MAAKDMLSNGTIAVSDMVTHVFPLADSVRAFEIAQHQQCMKAVVVD
jgi:threonine dehydrogenase-like Zn-dependent dehydrogenase